MLSEEGKLALITGATGALGRRMAVKLAELGFTVAVNGRSVNSVNKLVSELQSRSHSAIACVGDIGDESSVTNMFSVLARHGGLDVLINNAAARPFKDFLEIARTDWDEVMRTNLTGTFMVTQQAVAQMLKKGNGSIVSISSIAATEPPAYYRGVHYATAKSGVIGMTLSLAHELQNTGIKVNAIVPGLVALPERPLPPEVIKDTRVVDVEKVVEGICLLVTGDVKHTGEVVTIK